VDDHALGKSLEAQLMKALIASGVSAASALAHLVARARGELRPLEITRDLRYGTSPRQRLEVWRPRAPARAPRPLVLFLHGGGFQHLDPASHWSFAERFAQAGAVVVSAGYRLAPRHPYPAAADDARAAYRWTVDHARALGGDREALVVAGASAGGNLALGLAIGERYAGVAPRACVLFSGLLQVSDMARLYRRGGVGRLLRARMASIGSDYVAHPQAFSLPAAADPRLDPLLYLERSRALPPGFPAVFASSGTADQVLDDALRLRACLARLGAACEVDVVERAGHTFQSFTFRADARALWERAFAFLRAQGVQLVSARSSGAAS